MRYKITTTDETGDELLLGYARGANAGEVVDRIVRNGLVVVATDDGTGRVIMQAFRPVRVAPCPDEAAS